VTEALLARVPQACKMLNCSKPTLYKLLRAREINSLKLGRVRKIEVASIKEYIRRKIDADPLAVGGVVGQDGM